jgi:hypothetical protein
MEDYHRSNLVIYMGDRAIELLTWICKKEKRMNGEVLPNRIHRTVFFHATVFIELWNCVFFLEEKF